MSYSPELHTLALRLHEAEAFLHSLPRRSRRIPRALDAVTEIRREIEPLARNESRCVECLTDLDSPSAAGAEDGMCGDCAEVPF